MKDNTTLSGITPQEATEKATDAVADLIEILRVTGKENQYNVAKLANIIDEIRDCCLEDDHQTVDESEDLAINNLNTRHF